MSSKISIDKITGPVLMASSSTTNTSMNQNLAFLADFNKRHELNSLTKSATTSNLLKHKSYSFLMSKQLIKKVTGHSGQLATASSVNPANPNDIIPELNPVATDASSSVSSNLSYINGNKLASCSTNYNSFRSNSTIAYNLSSNLSYTQIMNSDFNSHYNGNNNKNNNNNNFSSTYSTTLPRRIFLKANTS